MNNQFLAWTGKEKITPDYITKHGVAFWTNEADNKINTSRIILYNSGKVDKNNLPICTKDLVKFHTGSSTIDSKIMVVEFYEGSFGFRMTKEIPLSEENFITFSSFHMHLQIYGVNKEFSKSLEVIGTSLNNSNYQECQTPSN